MHKKFLLNGQESESLTVYLPDDSSGGGIRAKKPSVVICPGGGYYFCSQRESDPVALSYLAAGYNAFVVRYSVMDRAEYPNPLIDLCKAMKIIRENADEWGVDTEKIAVCGFSAGGHLAASLGVYWNDDEIKQLSGCENGENKPNALILVYPVISSSWSENCYGQINKEVVGSNDYDTVYKKFNLHTQVNADTPQSFICHTFRDNVVPCEDSLKFAEALSKQDIPYELHIFPNGQHGLSLGTAELNEGGEDASFKQWFSLSLSWLKRKFENENEANTPVERAHYSSKL